MSPFPRPDYDRPVSMARRCLKCRETHICTATIRFCFCSFCGSDHVETTRVLMRGEL